MPCVYAFRCLYREGDDCESPIDCEYWQTEKNEGGQEMPAPYGERNGNGKKYTDEQVREARRLREAGRSYGQIAATLGVPYWTARGWADYRSRPL